MKYVIHDRDGKYCPAFDGILKSAGKKPIKLPARSPNLNAFAERWILSCKSECTRRILVIGEEGVWRAVQEYIGHHHTERLHQGLGNVVPAGWPDVGTGAPMLTKFWFWWDPAGSVRKLIEKWDPAGSGTEKDCERSLLELLQANSEGVEIAAQWGVGGQRVDIVVGARSPSS